MIRPACNTLRLGSQLLWGIVAILTSGTATAGADYVAGGFRHLSSTRGDLPVPSAGRQQTASLAVDIDGDGAEDIVTAERSASPSVTWLRRTPDGWTRYVIDAGRKRPEAGGAFTDIDGDGDPDIVFGGDGGSGDIWWWENPAPDFEQDTPWTCRTLKSDHRNKHHDQLFADVDGDGRDELVSWNQGANRLLLFEIPEDPHLDRPWPVHTVYAYERGGHEGLAAGDIDGDGVTDIVGAGRWFRHEGDHTFSTHVIDAGMGFTRAAVGQFVEGGYPEVAFVPGDANGPLKLYRTDDGTAWSATTLIDRVIHGHSLHTGDVHGDGHLDLWVAEMHTPGRKDECTAWIFFGDGQGGFDRQEVSRGMGYHEARLADLNGDGRLDVLVKPYTAGAPRIDVLLQKIADSGAAAGSFERYAVSGPLPYPAVYVLPGDLDGDGGTDLVAGGSWYRNPGSLSAAWEARDVGGAFANVAAVYDFDDDGDLDLLGTPGKPNSPRMLLAVNDGRGTFAVREVAEMRGDFLQGVAVARFQPGGPLEVALAWHKDGGGTQLLTVPERAALEPWPWRIISPRDLKEDLSEGDIDQDGDLDLLIGNVWLENPESAGATWPDHDLGPVTEGEADRNDLADLDGDGRLDAVVGLENGTDVLAYLQPGEDPRGPWTQIVIGREVGGGFSMDTADLDGDGDPDVVLGEHRGAHDTNRLLWFENPGPAALEAPWPEHVLDAGSKGDIDHHDGSRVADLDGDGDLDIVSLGWYNRRVWVFENKVHP